jgi:hypothetical protein
LNHSLRRTGDRATIAEQLNHVVPVALDRDIQGRVALVVYRVQFGAMIEEQLDQFRPGVIDGMVESG